LHFWKSFFFLFLLLFSSFYFLALSIAPANSSAYQ
jgi:hypothetical protein